jgi:predicted DNA-binding transcriptional regulator AlpA
VTRIVRIKEAMKITGLGRTSFYEEAKAGRIRLVRTGPGNGISGAVDSELEAYNNDRIRERDERDKTRAA